MSRFEDDYDEHGPSDSWLFSKAIIWGLGGLAVVVVLLVVWFSVKPSIIKLEGKSKVAVAEVERDVAKHSHQYVEGKESMLLTWLDEYREGQVEAAEAQAAGLTDVAMALEAQNATLADRIEREAQRLPEDELPESVLAFLKETQ